MATKPPVDTVRPCNLGDLPRLRALESRSVHLDTAYGLVYRMGLADRALLTRLPLARIRTPTYILRRNGRHVIGQLACRRGDGRASLIAITPAPGLIGIPPWVELLEGMIAAAGGRGIRSLRAEVDNDEIEALDALRQAGFIVYARQEIWRREPEKPPRPATSILSRPATGADAFGIGALFVSAVPKLVLQAESLPEGPKGGWICRAGDRVIAHLSVQRGRRGILIRPVVHPDLADMAEPALASALAEIRAADRLPTYCCVRNYQGWLRDALENIGFVPWLRQTVMIRYTTARVVRTAISTPEPVGRALAVPPIAE